MDQILQWMMAILYLLRSEHQKLLRLKSIETLFAVFLTNVKANTSIWTALHMFGNLEIIQKVLGSKTIVEEICDRCSLQSKSICSNKDDARSLSVLNKSQAAAVISSVSAVQCSHKSSPIQLVWGLPGTGKTKTLSVLLCIFLKSDYRVLTCAPTSIALTEVVSRVLKLVKEPYNVFQINLRTGGSPPDW